MKSWTRYIGIGAFLAFATLGCLKAYATDDTANVNFEATVPAMITLTCPATVTITVNAGSPPTSSTETVTCTINTNDEDDTVPVVMSGNLGGAGNDEVTITHTNGTDTLTVTLSNPAGAAAGSTIPNLSATITSPGVDENFTFDAAITDLANTTRAGQYTSATPLVLTATAL